MKLPPAWRAIDPRRLALFIAIGRGGSLSRAAAQLGLDRSAASRQLSQLEKDLGLRLVQRTTRRVKLTEAGELVLRQAEQVEHALARVLDLAHTYRKQIRGRLRVTCTMALGRRYVAPALAQLTAAHPDLQVALHLEDRLVDIVAEDFDVALRVSHLPDSSLVARKLADNPRIVVAAPAFLQRRRITRPEDLAHVPCLLYCSGSRLFDEWSLVHEGEAVRVRVRGQLHFNDGQALIAAAIAGNGVLAIDRVLLHDELSRGVLQQVLPQWLPAPGPPIYAVYPAREFLPAKTALFIDFIEQRLQAVDPGGAARATARLTTN